MKKPNESISEKFLWLNEGLSEGLVTAATYSVLIFCIGFTAFYLFG